MIKKAIIPAAGLGTRFLPVTKSMPKEMLPIIDKPIIQFVVEEAVASGIDDILIITGRGKRAVEDYFDTSPELETHLLNNKKYELLKEMKDISSMVDIHYIRQKEPKGLGDAVLRAEKHIDDEAFAVLLGDDIIRGELCIKQLMDVYTRYKCCVLAVEEVSDVSKYGIIKGEKIDGTIYDVEDIVEKPDVYDAPSRMGTVGRYIFTPAIFSCIKKIKPGFGGEIQLTDAIRMLIDTERVYAHTFNGKRYDAGNKADYVKAIIDFALEREDLRDEIGNYIEMKR
ncbi:MAG: UTP--glucose-1-phosphate uridylyltransferase GalU [Methanosarcinales archaeon]|uniref:UTP--glucose-1-phosphate uridylyltransferase n=1 Tax=Candidatus Ethanoperedens thermophilum TaxID=2766897 RepID=A0A848D862_9EURY|nr:UTP--glucose-1-phosphate uridylyltransferase GalU [Candidatus Ethanoperedens thermophilum]